LQPFASDKQLLDAEIRGLADKHREITTISPGCAYVANDAAKTGRRPTSSIW
jgi:hypothetical protein